MQTGKKQVTGMPRFNFEARGRSVDVRDLFLKR